MQRALIHLTQGPGLYVVYGMTYIVSFFYFLFMRREYKAIKSFYKRALKVGGFKATIYAYRSFNKMGQIVMDRFSAYGGRKFQIESPDADKYNKILESDGGVVQLSSHVGNYEMGGYMEKFGKKRLNALVFSGETQTVMENRKRMFEANNINMILTSSNMDHIYQINNALDRGEIVNLPADRLFGSTKSIKCDFFDGKIVLPMGPFIMAAQKNLPVVVPFVMKRGVTKYRIYINIISPISCSNESTREKATTIATKFAQMLEDMVKKYPSQWFNYFNVFEQ